MPKFLLDENVPPAIGVFLQSMNFDVVHSKEFGMLGASDDLIMDLPAPDAGTGSSGIGCSPPPVAG